MKAPGRIICCPDASTHKYHSKVLLADAELPPALNSLGFTPHMRLNAARNTVTES